MIQDLRFIQRNEPIDPIEAAKKERNEAFIGIAKRILQAYDGHVWFDVPLVETINDQ